MQLCMRMWVEIGVTATHSRKELQLASTVLVASNASRAGLCGSVRSRPKNARKAAALYAARPVQGIHSLGAAAVLRNIVQSHHCCSLQSCPDIV